MLTEITQWILETIRANGVLGVVIGVFLETILTPIPSPIVIMTAGLVLIEPGLALWDALWKIFFVITLPAAIAQTVGNYTIYGIAYHGGKPVINRFEKMLGFSWKDIQRLKRKFKIGKSNEAFGKEDLFLIVLRALPIMPLSVISGLAGILKIEWKRYGIFSFIGMLPRNFVLAFIGWKMSEAYVHFARQIDSIESVVTITIIGLIVGGIVLNKLKVFERIEKWATR